MFHQTVCICEMLSYQIFVNVIVPSGAARRSRAARRSPPPIALTAPLRHRARSARFAQDCPSPPPRDLSQTRRCPMLGPSAAAAHLRRREAARGVRRARARARAVPARFLPSGALSCKNAPSPSPRGRSAARRFAIHARATPRTWRFPTRESQAPLSRGLSRAWRGGPSAPASRLRGRGAARRPPPSRARASSPSCPAVPRAGLFHLSAAARSASPHRGGGPAPPPRGTRRARARSPSSRPPPSIF